MDRDETGSHDNDRPLRQARKHREQSEVVEVRFDLPRVTFEQVHKQRRMRDHGNRKRN